MRQTIIRMEETLYMRLKSCARRKKISLNGLMVGLLEEGTKNESAGLSAQEFAPSEELLSLGKVFSGVTKNASDYDEKTQSILLK